MRLFFILGVMFWVCTVTAHEYFTGNFRLVHPWSEATSPNVSEANVYCVFEDVQQSDRLIKAMSSIAETVQIRKRILDSSKNWEGLSALEIPANSTSQLSDGTAYLILVGLRAPLQWGRSYPMQLQFERAGIVNVMVSIGAH